MKYYIVASLKKTPQPDGKSAISRVGVYLGKMKAEITADDWQTAMERGKELISTIVKPGITPFDWAWMPVDDAAKLGDAEIYAKYPTASWITYYRIKRGWTQQQLADASSLNIRQIQKLENGETKVENTTVKNLFAIADALRVEPRALL